MSRSVGAGAGGIVPRALAAASTEPLARAGRRRGADGMGPPGRGSGTPKLASGPRRLGVGIVRVGGGVMGLG